MRLRRWSRARTTRAELGCRRSPFFSYFDRGRQATTSRGPLRLEPLEDRWLLTAALNYSAASPGDYAIKLLPASAPAQPQLEIVNGSGSVVAQAPLNTTSSVTFTNTSGGAITLSLDYSAGNPLPSEGLVFTGGGSDQLEVAHGTFFYPTVTDSGLGSGMLMLMSYNPPDVVYSGVASVDMSGSTFNGNWNVNINDFATDGILQGGPSAGQMQLAFTNHSNANQIFPASASGVSINDYSWGGAFQLAAPDSSFHPSSVVLGGSASNVFRLNAPDVLPSGASLAVNGGSLDLNGYHIAVNGLSGGGTITNNNAGSAATLEDDGTGSFSGSIEDGAGTVALVIGGPGAETLSGNSNYSGGTNVRQGTLLVDNTSGSATGSGAVSVENGATLGGTGAITGAVTVDRDGTLSPGDPAVGAGALATGPLTIEPGGNVDVLTTAPATKGPPGDQTEVDGISDIDGASVAVVLGFVPTSGDTIALLTGSAGVNGPVNLNGATINEGDDIFLPYDGNIYPFRLSYLHDSLILTFDQQPTIKLSGGGKNTVTISTSPTMPAGNVVADWRFEEGIAGQPATGAVIDSSGNNLNGAPVNGPRYSLNVPVGSLPQTGEPDHLSLAFDGADRVFIPDYPQLQLTHSLTVEAYIDPSSGFPYGQQQILFRGDDRPQLDPYNLFIQYQNGKNGQNNTAEVVFQIYNATGGEASVSAPLPGLNLWFHVAGTLDDATGTLTLYINGVEKDSLVTSVRPFAALDPRQSPGLGIGDTQSATDSEFFHGLIDEVRISNIALSPDQFIGYRPGGTVVTVNGATVLDEPTAALTTLNIAGDGNGDAVNVDEGHGDPLPSSGLIYDNGVKTVVTRSSNAEYVAAAFPDVLGRTADVTSLAYWTAQLDAGQPRSTVADAITRSDEYYLTRIIVPDYQRFLGRAPGAAEQKYWTEQLRGGMTDEGLEAAFIGSDEFYKNAGGSNKAWVDSMYQDLLGRAADSSGEAYWVDQLAHGIPRQTAALSVADSPEREQQRIADDYMTFLGRMPDQQGLAHWLSRFAQGATNEDLIASFVASEEYYLKHTTV